MPIVQITIVPQPTEKKAEMAKVITDEINRITDISKEVISVKFYEVPADSAALNGELLTEKFKREKNH